MPVWLHVNDRPLQDTNIAGRGVECPEWTWARPTASVCPTAADWDSPHSSPTNFVCFGLTQKAGGPTAMSMAQLPAAGTLVSGRPLRFLPTQSSHQDQYSWLCGWGGGGRSNSAGHQDTVQSWHQMSRLTWPKTAPHSCRPNGLW